jgi:hypothetical protein
LRGAAVQSQPDGIAPHLRSEVEDFPVLRAQ